MIHEQIPFVKTFRIQIGKKLKSLLYVSANICTVVFNKFLDQK